MDPLAVDDVHRSEAIANRERVVIKGIAIDIGAWTLGVNSLVSAWFRSWSICLDAWTPMSLFQTE